MRATNEIFNAVMRYDEDGFISAEHLDNPSNYGGITIAFKLTENQEPNSATFVVGYSRANVGSPVRKPDNFNRAIGKKLALENLNNTDSLQNFEIKILTPIESLDVGVAVRTVKQAILDIEIGDNAWYTSNTPISDVTLSELVVKKNDDSDYEDYYESDEELMFDESDESDSDRVNVEDYDMTESYSDDTDAVEIGEFESDNEIIITDPKDDFADGGSFDTNDNKKIVNEGEENIGD